MYSTILFDLDGTLTDSREGITKSIMYALECMKINHNETYKTLERFIGPPLSESFSSYWDDKDKIEEAVKAYRVRYNDIGWKENIPYDGVREMLAAVKASGKRLYLATSKPEIFAKKIMDLFELSGYFEALCGATTDGTRNTKNDVIKYVLSQIKDVPVSDILMVGDRKYDVEGAGACGIATLGVSYGFGSEEELKKAGAIDVCNTPAATAEYIINH